MKRICTVVLCLCLVMTGCQSNGNSNVVSPTEQAAKETNTANTAETANQNQESSKIQALVLDKKWSSVESVELEKTVYTASDYKANVKAYEIADDLSNVVNISQFSGFTEEQTRMLTENGFVVLPSRDTRMFYIYDSNEYTGVPNFITSDTVLHLYHQFYDKSLIQVESGYLYDDLELMTKQMLDKSIYLLQKLEDEELKKLQEKNVIYFLVARMLMLQTSAVSADVDADLLATAMQEYELIEKAEGIQKSPLLGYDLDYSQFTVRGHYTRTKELGKFFRTMMWFGSVPYSFFNDQKEYQYDQVLQSLLITFTTFAESETTCDAELWSNIYLPTAQYVGLSDDIDVFTMNSLRKSVFGDTEDPNSFNDEEYYDKLLQAVIKLPEPQIQGKTVTSSIATNKQFRFMGQRYVLDSDILQTLIDPYLRPIPTSLDVMGVLGSSQAEELLFNVYKPQDSWPEYTQNYSDLKQEVSEYTPEVWGTNLYSGWLWSLKESLTEYGKDSGMPFFMTTAAWKNKTLNTALGSYTELKHDTVLYGKQAMAEGGGAVEYADQHYVEPDIELYNRLLYLTDYTVSVLKKRGMLNESLQNGADKYKELLNLLIDCSAKELNNKPLTEEENKKLLLYGSTMENISNAFLGGIVDTDYPTIELSDMLVTDISSYNGTYLSLGTGYFDNIYVIVPVDGKLYLSRGSVYSFYEFDSDTRLTDEAWWELQGITVTHEEYADYVEMEEPSKQLPKQPFWTDSFKIGTNNVAVQPLEVDWDKLNN